MISPESFGDSELQHAEKLLSCKFDDARVRVLRSTDTCDVHACPGSGKTTLLVAKLAMMARNWPHRDRGILVLSHTNVARREVERKLAGDAAGSRLLAYPHFIGTIQAFVDRFLAMPYLREVGIRGVAVDEPRIDDDFFAAEAWRRFTTQGSEYSAARGYLIHRKNKGKDIVTTLFYKGENCALATEKGKLPKPDTDTTCQLSRLKEALAADGIFRYADMFAFAESSIRRHDFLLPAFRQRFPWVFIDEMQDTAAHQDVLLQRIFGSHCIVQRFGDKNQGIFGQGDEDELNSFSWRASLDLPQSHRFGRKLATFASRLTAVHAQTLEGNPDRPDRCHTILLFNDRTIRHAVAAFGNIILREWPQRLPPGFVAKAVGFRKSQTESSKMPARIGDYWPSFPSDVQRDRVPRLRFIHSVRWARHLIATEGEYYAGQRAALDAIAQLLEHIEGTRVTRRSLLDRVKRAELDRNVLRKVIVELCRPSKPITERYWNRLADRIVAVLAPGKTASNVCQDYLAWDPLTALPGASQDRPVSNVYLHESKGRTVEIAVSTIHGVKGETHDATLLLETFDREHDLQVVLPFLAGASLSSLRKRQVTHMKRAFVGLTRPKELVCLAVHQEHAVPADLERLRAMGWEIEEVAPFG